MQKIHWPSLLKATLTFLLVPLLFFILIYIVENYLRVALIVVAVVLGLIALYSLYELYKTGYYDRNDG